MSSSWLGIGAGALAGSVIGTLVTLALVPRPEAPKARAETQQDEGERDEDDDLDDAPLSAVEARLSSLEKRVSLLILAAARPHSAPAEGDSPSPSTADVADPVFEAAVLDILDRQQERREQDREQRRVAGQNERRTRTLKSLEEKLSLNPRQLESLGVLLEERTEMLESLRGEANRSASREEWQTRMEELNASFDKKLAEVLTDAQLESYKQLPSEERVGAAPGGRRGQRAP